MTGVEWGGWQGYSGEWRWEGGSQGWSGEERWEGDRGGVEWGGEGRWGEGKRDRLERGCRRVTDGLG